MAEKHTSEPCIPTPRDVERQIGAIFYSTEKIEDVAKDAPDLSEWRRRNFLDECEKINEAAKQLELMFRAGLPTAALEGDGVSEAIEEARRRFNVVKGTAYKLPNKCECSGSEACVTCQLLGDIGDLEEALSRIDAALAAGEKR